MASTLAAAAGKKQSTELKYSAIKFNTYYRLLEAKCSANKNANIVLMGKDPVMRFQKRNPTIVAELEAAKRPTEEEIFDDPRTIMSKFLDDLQESTMQHKLFQQTVVHNQKPT